MAKSENQKIKLVVLLDILKMYSDEEHPLSTNEIINKLAFYGVETGRKALYDDIETLNRFGYEVITVKSRSNLYYVVDRKFDAAELRILMDAVLSADFITEKKTEELTKKIAEMAGVHKAKLMTKNIVYSDTAKHSNEKVYYSVDAADRAIAAGKKLTFRYFDLDCHGQRKYRKNGDIYTVNPVALIFNENKYYLTCYNDKYMNLSNYRIDRMDNVEMSEEDITPSPCKDNFNVNRHRKQAFSMYCGETEKVTFSVTEDALEVIFDRFGEKTKFAYYGDRYKFSANVQVSPTFYGWCASLGEKIKILSPVKVAEEYREYLKNIVLQYAEADKENEEK